MTAFEASNGASVNETAYPGFKMLTVHTPDNTLSLAGIHVDVLREFFQHERDEELGRWRWPEHPDFLVYSRGHAGVRVTSESSGDHILAVREAAMKWKAREATYYGAARAYFDAHPERKPWEDAKPGEAWEITYTTLVGPEVTKVAIRTDRNTWKTDVLEMEFNYAITSARRIWPEDAS